MQCILKCNAEKNPLYCSELTAQSKRKMEEMPNSKQRLRMFTTVFFPSWRGLDRQASFDLYFFISVLIFVVYFTYF